MTTNPSSKITAGQIVLLAIKALDEAAAGQPVSPQAAQVVADGLRAILGRIEAQREHTQRLQDLDPAYLVKLRARTRKTYESIARRLEAVERG